MAKVTSGVKKKTLWIKLQQGNIEQVSHPKRLRSYVQVDRLQGHIAIDKLLLTVGVFVGKAVCCPLRLDAMPDMAPRVCLRFDVLNRWTVYGMGDDAFLNSRMVPPAGLLMKIGDILTIGPYSFEIVDEPDDEEVLQTLRQEIDSILPGAQEGSDPFLDTDFELKMP